MFPLPDSRAGGGYGVNNKGMGTGGELRTGDVWPYILPTELEDDFDEEELGPEREEVDGKQDEWLPTDRLWYLNQRAQGFVKSNRMDAGVVRIGSLLEVLSGARGQAGISYDPMNPDATVRTRPGRYVGSKRGWFQPHPAKETDPSPRRYSLKDIAAAEETEPLDRVEIETDRVLSKNVHAEGRIPALRAYIRLVALYT